MNTFLQLIFHYEALTEIYAGYHTHARAHAFSENNIPHFHRLGLVVSGESYEDYKLVVSNAWTTRDISFIMVTDTRQGLFVKTHTSDGDDSYEK